MALRSLPFVLLLIRLYKEIIVSATTTVHYYTDASCKTPYASVQTDTDAGNGQCGEFDTAINSASSSAIDYGCSVTVYTGPSDESCSYDATLVPIGSCTVMSIGSFSVDCPQINGTYDPGYSTILASDMSSSTSLTSTTLPSSTPPSNALLSAALLSTTSTSTSSVTISPKSSSQQSSTTGIPSPHPSSSTTSSLPETPTSPLRDIRPSSSSTSQPSSPPLSSPSSSQGQRGSGNDGGLSGPSTIAIGVVLPGVAVIATIVFGVKRWRNDRKFP